ncbi:MAG TPA: class II D-tagatose-bisphosphate aldolase, non-catalytic subunit [Terriglobales bacterium]|nr:class II D-tagatose-bisphosphate aldolase, non-catalytic subunit [Terriglobales bacterium]
MFSRVAAQVEMTTHADSKGARHVGATLQAIIRRNRASRLGGEYAVCSAHPQVIAAAAHQAQNDDSFLHVESTSNQVNQFGGYTGQTPEQFASFVREIARRSGLTRDRILLGGDHLGPYPWRDEPAAAAMEKAQSLVRACVLAGYQKIHLDASMTCTDDGKGALDERTVADRAATLCQAAETTFRELPPNSPPLLYVVGTEVPTPGGELGSEQSLAVTTPAHVDATLKTFHQAFTKRRLDDAWQRVIGLVVQPGVEFGNASIFEYSRSKAEPLTTALPVTPELVYEAHSTDYQLPSALKEMVEDHFAILKVGPELTFAFREAVFALWAIEQEMLRSKTARASKVREALEAAMLRNPKYWRDYYQGDENEIGISLFYSYSDRCRYYWPDAAVQKEIELLIENLTSHPPVMTLVSQYLPLEYEAIRAGALPPRPPEIIQHHIGAVLGKYAHACGQSVFAR